MQYPVHISKFSISSSCWMNKYEMAMVGKREKEAGGTFSVLL
jgi:hypothetical protein